MIDDDKILLIALREQNEKAFDIIFRKYFKSIYHFVYKICKSSEDAEDLTQEIFVKLWENAQTVSIVSLKGYLFTLAKGMVIDWTRKKVNQLVFETLADKHAVCAEEFESNEKAFFEYLLSMIHHIAQSMPERRREVYCLRWKEGLSRKEIAERMGISVATVDVHLQKALESLRAAVSKVEK
ncbi:MAG: RNA polymerase sigma-70 factor [Tannerellaceae bacterium]|nr:RNA polymerase sigma-70 factor [Tannerellaceae bacterium]